MNNTGYFVAVDGPNGSGKTTVINAIAEKPLYISHELI